MTEQPEPDELERVRRETARKVALEAIAVARAALREQRKGRDEADARGVIALHADPDGCPVVVGMARNATQDFLVCNAPYPCAVHPRRVPSSGPMETPTQEPEEQK